jgi:hypothetical protein
MVYSMACTHSIPSPSHSLPSSITQGRDPVTCTKAGGKQACHRAAVSSTMLPLYRYPPPLTFLHHFISVFWTVTNETPSTVYCMAHAVYVQYACNWRPCHCWRLCRSPCSEPSGWKWSCLSSPDTISSQTIGSKTIHQKALGTQTIHPRTLVFLTISPRTIASQTSHPRTICSYCRLCIHSLLVNKLFNHKLLFNKLFIHELLVHRLFIHKLLVYKLIIQILSFNKLFLHKY